MTQSSEELNGVETTAGEAAQAKPRTDRDLQRSALRDLVELATDCAATEAEIETRLSTTLEGAERALAQTSSTLSLRFDSMRQQVQKKHAERIAEAQAQ